MSDLFATEHGPPSDTALPLAERLRPRRLSDVIGQEHIVGPDGALTRMLASGSLGSLML